jgi:XTP/dITP diphosphohydrolase
VELIVLATGNAGKVVELTRLLAGVAGRFESLRDHPTLVLPEEGESSYRENALGKARAVNDALGLPALGDDSGLEVDALDGAPGIRSARYAGALAGDRLNNDRLLEALRGASSERRTARFRCVLALVRGPGDERIVEGVCEGRIVAGPRGDGGFGYDPLFEPAGASLTFAEMSGPTKDALSHRALAAAALRAALAAIPR